MQGRLLFLLAILIGGYSYILLFIGIFGLLNKFNIRFITLIVFILVGFSLATNLESLKSLYIQARNHLFYFLLFLFFILINLAGALGPELGFDALWYHLTLPKLYIEAERIYFVTGGVLYYSVMPKLVDLLYIPALMFSNEIAAKLIHFSFGILSSIVTYKIANLFVDKKLSYLAALIFYSNLVVGWLSITAYIDLGRVFFAGTSIYFLLLYFKERSIKFLILSSVLLGLEISTKLLGFCTLISLLICILLFSPSQSFLNRFKRAFFYLILPIVIILPWIIFSYSNTSSMFYPFFTSIYPSEISILSFNPLTIIKNTFNLFLFSADPISPIYFIVIPLVIFLFKKTPREIRVIITIILINIIIWNFIPQKNSRFIIPYLPLMSVLVVWILNKVKSELRAVLLIVIYLTFVVNLIYRGVANFRYVPVITGIQSKEDFLIKNLNFQFGDYIDVNNDVKNIVGKEKVLVKNIHNLYYINFSFDHESWREEENYKYILSRDKDSEKGYNLIYANLLTNTYLYESSE